MAGDAGMHCEQRLHVGLAVPPAHVRRCGQRRGSEWKQTGRGDEKAASLAGWYTRGSVHGPMAYIEPGVGSTMAGLTSTSVLHGWHTKAQSTTPLPIRQERYTTRQARRLRAQQAFSTASTFDASVCTYPDVSVCTRPNKWHGSNEARV